MILEVAATLVGYNVEFSYKGEKRKVLIQQAKACKNGKHVIIGLDLDAETKALNSGAEIGSEAEFTRTFQLDKVQGVNVYEGGKYLLSYLS